MNYNYVNGIEVLLRTVSEYHAQKNRDNDIQQKELTIDNCTGARKYDVNVFTSSCGYLSGYPLAINVLIVIP